MSTTTVQTPTRARRVTTGLAALALSGSLLAAGAGLSPAAAAESQRSPASPVVSSTDQAKVTAKVRGVAEDGRKVVGRFTPERFVAGSDGVEVVGEITGKLVGKRGQRTFTETVRMPVQEINGTDLTDLPTGSRADVARDATRAAQDGPACDVLNLVLGPLDLDLLGLEVSLNRVVLDIVARSGAGNLLGNLLCAVTGLLDGLSLGPVLQRLVDALNDLLGGLRL
ncbi:hypothetical protein [uncultured Nocardioides sp.]|uniref:hypothetical protein n=1 Tax=uncultured Nocardioides sp. TaxID=198441 RepID=UPI00261E1806|nr:hypothetical protein [uncultured Nocardioides sp.]